LDEATTHVAGQTVYAAQEDGRVGIVGVNHRTIRLAIGKAIECAEVIVLFGSDAASYVVGESIEVNGGQLMLQIPFHTPDEADGRFAKTHHRTIGFFAALVGFIINPDLGNMRHLLNAL
jgi:hypothetical protein